MFCLLEYNFYSDFVLNININYNTKSINMFLLQNYLFIEIICKKIKSSK